MNSQQINNLIYFTLLFSPFYKSGTAPVPDSSLFNSHQRYIMDKWAALIKVEPTKITKLNTEQLETFLLWSKRWGVKDLDSKTTSVINYLCCIYIKKFSFNDMLVFFEKHIGDCEKISSDEYRHLHALFVRYCEVFKSQNRRQINLHLLLHE